MVMVDELSMWWISKPANTKARPLVEPLFPTRPTKVHPLPIVRIEQASTNGNATVTEEPRWITQIDGLEPFKS
jgi:hypothetical protein